MQFPKKSIKVAQFGLGPIGVESLRLLADTPWAEVVGGIDIDPAKVGVALDVLTGRPGLSGAAVHARFDDLLASVKPDVVLHTAGSSVDATIDQILPMVDAGVAVATTCEPMLYPWLTAPHKADLLDATAETRQVSVVSTGVNPGFVMDLLPIVATGVMRRVEAVRVTRVVDASSRREPLQRKVGSGMAPPDFRARFLQGKAGHAGFRESVALIASAMGWPASLDAIEESLEPVIAEHEIRTGWVTVRPGQTRGLHQVATLHHKEREVIRLDLTMALEEPNPHDTVRIDGEPAIRLEIPGGVSGDVATVASLVNVVPRLMSAAPGLRLMTDLAAPVHRESAARSAGGADRVTAGRPPRVEIVAPSIKPVRAPAGSTAAATTPTTTSTTTTAVTP